MICRSYYRCRPGERGLELKIPDGTSIPDGAVVKNQKELKVILEQQEYGRKLSDQRAAKEQGVPSNAPAMGDREGRLLPACTSCCSKKDKV